MDEINPSHWRTRLEIAVLAGVTVVIGVALFGAFSRRSSFLLDHWLREDGVVEWLTVLGLLLCAGVCVYRVVVFRSNRPFGFLLGSLLGAAAFLFGAGEEISWGQRLFGMATPEWFLEHNLQEETNVHNLLIGDRDLNKLLFGKVLTLGLAVFLLFPVLYGRSDRFTGLTHRFGVPVPRPRHALTLFAMALLLPLPEMRGRSSELFEFVAVFLVLIILLNPLNLGVFEGGEPGSEG